MAISWFETVAEAQRLAKKNLPPSVYSALIAGSEKGVTLNDNQAAFGELGFAPHTAGLSDKRDLATTVLGQSISFPVIISPTGVQAVHPDGEVAVARAAAARGTAMALSSFGSKPIEEVIAANPKTFFQLYWMGSRDDMLRRIERARAAGAVGLIATLDWSFGVGRDWGSPRIPERMTFAEMLRFERELAAAEGAEGVIPQDSARHIVEQLPDFVLDMDKIRIATARDGTIGVEFVRQLREWLGPPYDLHVHFGSTSQDLVDTALVVRLRSILVILRDRLTVLREQPSCRAISLISSPLRAITRISTACSWVNIDGQKAAIVAQVGHFYSGAVGQFYIGANNRSPVMRWPTLWKRPSFLMSMCSNSPGCSRS